MQKFIIGQRVRVKVGGTPGYVGLEGKILRSALVGSQPLSENTGSQLPFLNKPNYQVEIANCPSNLENPFVFSEDELEGLVSR